MSKVKKFKVSGASREERARQERWGSVPPDLVDQPPEADTPKFDSKRPENASNDGLEESKEDRLKQLLMDDWGASAGLAAQICAQVSAEFDRVANGGRRPVPQVAPLLYKDRPNRTHRNDSLEFLKEHYGPWLGEGGGLYRPHLRKLDPQLVDALTNLLRGARLAEFAQLVPKKAAQSDARLERAFGDVPTGRERKNALTALSNRRPRHASLAK